MQTLPKLQHMQNIWHSSWSTVTICISCHCGPHHHHHHPCHPHYHHHPHYHCHYLPSLQKHETLLAVFASLEVAALSMSGGYHFSGVSLVISLVSVH